MTFVTLVTVKYKCVKLKERLTEIQSVNMKAILIRETFNLKENIYVKVENDAIEISVD